MWVLNGEDEKALGLPPDLRRSGESQGQCRVRVGVEYRPANSKRKETCPQRTDNSLLAAVSVFSKMQISGFTTETHASLPRMNDGQVSSHYWFPLSISSS
jgi:hypothetical protein